MWRYEAIRTIKYLVDNYKVKVLCYRRMEAVLLIENIIIVYDMPFARSGSRGDRERNT